MWKILFKQIYALFVVLVFALIFTGCGCENVNKEINTSKKEIVFAVGRDTTRTYSRLAQEFCNVNKDINVKVIELGTNSDNFHRKLSSILACDEIKIDICLIEDVWVKDFVQNKYIQNIEPYIETDFSDYINGFETFSMNNGKLCVLPAELDVGALYSTDNVNLNNLYDLLKSNCAVGSSDDEEVICTLLQLINYTGSIEDGIKLYRDFMLNSSHKTFSDFKNGSVPYAISRSIRYPEAVDGFKNVSSKIIMNPLIFENCQKCTVGRVYCYAVTKNAQDKEGIKKFLEFLSSDKAQMQLLRDRGTSPVKYSQYKNDIILDYNGVNDKLKSHIDSIALRPQRTDYSLLSFNICKSLSECISDESKYEEVLKYVEEFLK